MKKIKRFHVEVLGDYHDYVITKDGDIYVDALPSTMRLSYNSQNNKYEVISTYYREFGKLLMSGSLPFCLVFIRGAIRADLLTLKLFFGHE